MPEHVMPAAPAQQSSFVTGLAWTLIVFNALGILVLLLQNLTLNLVYPTLMQEAAPGQETSLAIFRGLGFVFLAISVFLTYAAYALLKRRNWARVTYIVVFALAIASHVISALLVVAGLGTAVELGLAAAGGGEAVPPEMAGVVRVTMIVFVIILLAMAVLFGWLIKRLRSPEVKSEFAS
jgi:hypothetical protein